MKKVEIQKQVLSVGLILSISALVGTGLMSLVNWHSKPYVDENKRLQLQRTLNAVVAQESYDNNFLNDTILVSNVALLGNKESATVYRARKGKLNSAIALTVVAPNGYNGNIELLVGIKVSGQISGVRVLSHRETPGLGDAIEIQRSEWINSFTDKSISNLTISNWKVKRDGGEFDQFTGATITPRAVVGAVYKSLLYFDKNRDTIFNTKSESQAEKDKDNILVKVIK